MKRSQETAARAALRDDGEFIPPLDGDPVCEEYDEAGPAALDADGFPQCAMCGWPKTFHDVQRRIA